MIKHNNTALLVYRDRSADEIRDIALTSYQNKSWSEPKIIHQDNWTINGCPVNAPAIASNSSGYDITWFSAANNTESVNLTAQNNHKNTFYKTLEIGNTFGYVDMTTLDDSNVILSRLSLQNNDLKAPAF